MLSVLIPIVLLVLATVVGVALVRQLRTKEGRVPSGACDACASHAPLMHATYHQNTGMLVMRRYRQESGNFCRGCHRDIFARLTLHTAVLGWWGMISAVLTPLFLLNNIGLFVASQTLPSTAALTGQRLEQHREYALNLIATKDLETVVEVLRKDTGATDEQIRTFVEELRRAG